MAILRTIVKWVHGRTYRKYICIKPHLLKKDLRKARRKEPVEDILIFRTTESHPFFIIQ